MAALSLQLVPVSARSDELLVFAAASLTDVLQELARPFEDRTGLAVRFHLAGSGSLAQQIRRGAPADLFFSADVRRLTELERQGLLEAGSRRDILSNRLVVIVPRESGLSVAGASDLLQVRRLALGDPETVPAGRYAAAYLQGTGLWARLQPVVVPALDVRAVLAAVESGHAEAGIVYATDAALSSRVRTAYEVPLAEGPTIRYGVALLRGRSHPGAWRLLEHFTSHTSRRVFESHGFVFIFSFSFSFTQEG